MSQIRYMFTNVYLEIFFTTESEMQEDLKYLVWFIIHIQSNRGWGYFEMGEQCGFFYAGYVPAV